MRSEIDTRMDRLRNALNIVDNSDMESDDKRECILALLYAMQDRQYLGRRQEWITEPGVAICQVLMFVAAFIVVWHSNIAPVLAMVIGYWLTALIFTWRDYV